MHSPSFPYKLLYADTSCNRWLSLPLLPSCDASVANFHASSASLLCLSTTSAASSTEFHIWNPLSRSHFILPRHRGRVRLPLLLAFCPSPVLNANPSFKIVIAGDKAIAERNEMFNSELDLSVQVYQSATHGWRAASAPVRGAACRYSDPVRIRSKNYWLSRSGLKKHILVYNDEDEEWSFLGSNSSSWWPDDCCPYTLWTWKGLLFMAGERSDTLTIWQLSKDESEWIEFAHIRSQLISVDHFCGTKDVAGHGPFLCVMLVWARKGLVYDLRTASLSSLPYCPVSSFGWGNVLPYMLGYSSISHKDGHVVLDDRHCQFL